MFSNRLFSYFSYEIKYRVSYIKRNPLALATTCKRSHLDKINGAPVGSFRVCIDELKKKPVHSLYSTDEKMQTFSVNWFVFNYSDIMSKAICKKAK